VTTGVGFLGAGTILKLSEQHEIRGLTTAASIWVTAAVGAAIGAGMIWLGILGVALAWFALYVLGHIERRFEQKDNQP
jgi:putative Mg2+ transporter-C (MgtC) family protein